MGANLFYHFLLLQVSFALSCGREQTPSILQLALDSNNLRDLPFIEHKLERFPPSPKTTNFFGLIKKIQQKSWSKHAAPCLSCCGK